MKDTLTAATKVAKLIKKTLDNAENFYSDGNIKEFIKIDGGLAVTTSNKNKNVVAVTVTDKDGSGVCVQLTNKLGDLTLTTWNFYYIFEKFDKYIMDDFRKFKYLLAYALESEGLYPLNEF